jgi:predicted transcriptional regulator
VQGQRAKGEVDMGGEGSGRGGISIDLVKACERLLTTAGWQTGEIARELGIDRSTVQRIARGEHFLQLQIELQNPRYARCSGCGAMTDEQPCKLCKLRAAGL